MKPMIIRMNYPYSRYGLKKDTLIDAIYVWFQHNVRELDKTTICKLLIYERQGDYVKVREEIGEAKCSLQDQFCRETGRKYALLRAARTAFPVRDDRIAFMEAYRKEKGKLW